MRKCLVLIFMPSAFLAKPGISTEITVLVTMNLLCIIDMYSPFCRCEIMNKISFIFMCDFKCVLLLCVYNVYVYPTLTACFTYASCDKLIAALRNKCTLACASIGGYTVNNINTLRTHRLLLMSTCTDCKMSVWLSVVHT